MLWNVLICSDWTFVTWSALFAKNLGQNIFVNGTDFIGAHAWIGLWTVSTDYLKMHWYALHSRRYVALSCSATSSGAFKFFGK